MRLLPVRLWISHQKSVISPFPAVVRLQAFVSGSPCSLTMSRLACVRQGGGESVPWPDAKCKETYCRFSLLCPIAQVHQTAPELQVLAKKNSTGTLSSASSSGHGYLVFLTSSRQVTDFVTSPWRIWDESLCDPETFKEQKTAVEIFAKSLDPARYEASDSASQPKGRNLCWRGKGHNRKSVRRIKVQVRRS